ncbi:MAG: Asp-tRNA(Asn)/Glu-tRNA(Gln) amidotransferase subunit GatA [Deltaproteobacteria bacterium]|nr:MAG: Asp-tRNA(Asn)/Glu-tRNA(Gln) amidotransferase subunit GatA [Deltaproteobacteria bacterium]
MTELYDLTIHELQDLLKTKKASSQEITTSVFQRIKSVEPRVQAYITLTEESALAQAKLADEKISSVGAQFIAPLFGIPIGIKDNFLTEGIKTTAGSNILNNYIPPYNGTTVQKLLDAGAIIPGKLNMDEFAMGSSNETSFFGTPKNPWDLERIAGGSSGGSAAAVAAGECFASTGTDTGGSIRLPAALTNLVGIKPTYGRVSRYGVIAFASSLDQVGPLTKDVMDGAIMLQALAGHDPKDSTSINTPVPNYVEGLKKLPKDLPLKGWKIAIPKEYFVEGMDAEVSKATQEAIETLKRLGAECREVSLPHTQYGVPTYYILATAEASSNLARYDGIRYGHRKSDPASLVDLYKKSRSEGFGSEVKRRIMLGTYVLSAGYYDAYYIRAQKVRTLIRQDFEKVFEENDVILTPVSPTPAWKIGEKAADPLKMYLSDIFTININLAGLPALSLPCGMTQSGLPIGMQIVSKHFQEEKMLQAAYAYEQATSWSQMRARL